MENARLTEPLVRWDTAKEGECSIRLPLANEDSRFLDIPIHTSIKSMLFFDLVIEDVSGETVYQTTVTVEWAGLEHLYLSMPKLMPQRAHTIVLRAKSFTFAGTVLSVYEPAWLVQRPLLRVNEGERLLDIFMNECHYRLDMWTQEQNGPHAGATDGELQRDWNFVRLKLNVPQDAESGAVAYSREYDHDIRDYQAFIVCITIERSARFSLYAEIDGEEKRLIDGHQGAGMEEIRVPLSGSRLKRITIRLDGESGEQVAHLYWFMLERSGTDPLKSLEVTGMDDIAAPEGIGSPENRLPLRLLFGEEELDRLKDKIRSGKAKSIYDAIVAEAEANLSYRPESYVGTYFPASWGNQGIERVGMPVEKTRQWFSTLVYSSLAYLLGGKRKYGLAARRALLAAISCQEWCVGFVARLPKGFNGYRAPFMESHLMQGVALCYDFIGDLLSDEERRAVEDAVYEKAVPRLDMFLRKNGEGYLLESNQGAVYSMGIIYACLVAGRSHPDVDAILERQVDWCLRMMGNYYKADGTTGEGMMYWEYTTHHVVECLLLIARYRNQKIADIVPPNLKEAMDYVLHMRSLSEGGLIFLPIADCRAEPCRYIGPSLLFFANYFGDTAADWMWHRYYDVPRPPGSSSFGHIENTGQYTSNSLLTLLLFEDRPTAEPALPESRRFECDRFFWRTGYSDSDMLLFFEGGRQSFEHAHFDKGQFIFQAYGETIAADPGMLHYSKPEHVHYLKSSYHNIVTIRGANQSYRNAEEAVQIRAHERDGSLEFLHADLANSYKELDRYDRTLLFVRDGYMVVLDELVSPSGGIEWNFHSRCDFRSAGDNRFIAESPIAGFYLDYAGNTALDCKLSRYSDEETVTSRNLVLLPDPETAVLNLAAVLVPYPVADGPSSVSVSSEWVPGGVAFTVGGPWGSDTLLVRLGGEPVIWNGSRITDKIKVIRNGASPQEKSY